MDAALPSQSGQNIRPRLAAVDAYRGFVMLSMAGAGFGLPQAAPYFPNNRVWQWFGREFTHSPWVGATFWDLIQPSFMFLVGASVAFSRAHRRREGEPASSTLAHAIYRSVALVLLGLMIESQSTTRDNYVLTNVLSQIGLGYVFVFLLCHGALRWQLLAVAAILLAHWTLFYAYPAPPADFDYRAVGVPDDWPHLRGVEAHWDKNTNVGAAVDRAILNCFRYETRFVYHGGGYTTLNFIPSLATMILGLMAGRLLRSGRSPREKFLRLCGAGLLCLGIGALIASLGICPLVKRVWTPSWAVYSAGWSYLLLAAFFGLTDLCGFRRAAWPLSVVGMNSLAAYYLALTVCAADGLLARGIQASLGPGIFTLYGRIGEAFAPMFRMTVLVGALWIVCVWLYQRKIFIKL